MFRVAGKRTGICSKPSCASYTGSLGPSGGWSGQKEGEKKKSITLVVPTPNKKWGN